MFIVLEGADASGKSTLAEEIKSQLKRANPGAHVEEFHKGRPDELTRRWALHEYAVDVEHIDWTSRFAVSDRWHWGEVTYAPIKRPETCKDEYGLLGIAGWRWVELFLESRGVAQFWIYQPLDVITERINSRGDDFVDAHELAGILDRYEFGYHNAYNVELKVTVPNGLNYVKYTADAIINAAIKKSKAAEPLSRFPTYIGPRYPTALLIGDKRNDPTETILPFMPINGNSGDYLLSSLPSTGWRSCGIINSDDFSEDSLTDLLDVLGQPKIVALGRLAEKKIRQCGLNDDRYVVLPHPQYVRRFHHQDRFEYGNAILSFVYNRDERYTHWILP